MIVIKIAPIGGQARIQVFRDRGGPVFANTVDLNQALQQARGAAVATGDQVQLVPGALDGLEIVTPDNQPVTWNAEDVPTVWPPASLTVTEAPTFPPAPARAVGADPGEDGPSALGVGEDENFEPGAVDAQDAAGVIGGVMADAIDEVEPVVEPGEPDTAADSTDTAVRVQQPPGRGARRRRPNGEG